MKKVLRVLLAMGLSVSMLAGCGSKSAETAADTSAPATEGTTAAAEPTDAGKPSRRQQEIRCTISESASWYSMRLWTLQPRDLKRH